MDEARLAQENLPAPKLAQAIEITTALRRMFGTTLDQLSSWISSHALEVKLEGGALKAQLAKYEQAYADGEYGFKIDPSQLRIPDSPEFRNRLQRALAAGAVTGIVIEAYPTEEQVRDMVTRTVKKAKDRPKEVGRILNMPVTEFLMEHFEKRGATIIDKASRVDTWKRLRWPAAGEPGHAACFKEVAEDRREDPVTAWIDADTKARTPAYEATHSRSITHSHPSPLSGRWQE